MVAVAKAKNLISNPIIMIADCASEHDAHKLSNFFDNIAYKSASKQADKAINKYLASQGIEIPAKDENNTIFCSLKEKFKKSKKKAPTEEPTTENPTENPTPETEETLFSFGDLIKPLIYEEDATDATPETAEETVNPSKEDK